MANTDRRLACDIALVGVASRIVGLSFGAITVTSGLPGWLPTLMSLSVFAGAAQFVFVGIVAAGGNPVAAVIAGLLTNTRLVPFGFAVADVLPTGWAGRIAGSHLMVDQSVAFALAQRAVPRRRMAYWLSGTSQFMCWNTLVLLGAFGGSAVHNTSALGLDAAFPRYCSRLSYRPYARPPCDEPSSSAS